MTTYEFKRLANVLAAGRSSDRDTLLGGSAKLKGVSKRTGGKKRTQVRVAEEEDKIK